MKFKSQFDKASRVDLICKDLSRVLFNYPNKRGDLIHYRDLHEELGYESITGLPTIWPIQCKKYVEFTWNA